MREIFGMKLWSRPEYFDPRRIRAREDFQPEIQTLILKKKKKTIMKRLLSKKKIVKIQTLVATPKTSRMFFVIFFHDIDREGLSTFQEKNYTTKIQNTSFQATKLQGSKNREFSHLA